MKLPVLVASLLLLLNNPGASLADVLVEEQVSVDQQAVLILESGIHDLAASIQKLGEKVKTGADLQGSYESLVLRQEQLYRDFVTLGVLEGTEEEDLLVQSLEALRLLAEPALLTASVQ